MPKIYFTLPERASTLKNASSHLSREVELGPRSGLSLLHLDLDLGAQEGAGRLVHRYHLELEQNKMTTRVQFAAEW